MSVSLDYFYRPISKYRATMNADWSIGAADQEEVPYVQPGKMNASIFDRFIFEKGIPRRTSSFSTVRQ